mmetsp:Transcript_1076/g.1716  ORF Transcript_1076/g.1716 Transcript_1076/m.1716 type:complete len:216 (+) Transcript_1076:191-838(+)
MMFHLSRIYYEICHPTVGKSKWLSNGGARLNATCPFRRDPLSCVEHLWADSRVLRGDDGFVRPTSKKCPSTHQFDHISSYSCFFYRRPEARVHRLSHHNRYSNQEGARVLRVEDRWPTQFQGFWFMPYPSVACFILRNLLRSPSAPNNRALAKPLRESSQPNSVGIPIKDQCCFPRISPPGRFADFRERVHSGTAFITAEVSEGRLHSSGCRRGG